MTCPRCQAEHDAAARFCEDCGARLEHACPRCGEPVTAGKKFCRSCGASLGPRFEAPDRYTPKHLADKIITSKSALEGERKQVTVLFADLKGSMELLAERDPEEARGILDPVVERMMEAVHRYEGTVNLVMGDGIMALFGAPVAHEDHAVRACYAALRMQEAVKRYAEEARQSQGIPVQIRVGLNAGEVVVGSIGNDLRMDYTAIGRTTHLAARMEQMAPPGSILITADTLRLAEGFAEAKPLGPMPVKGLSEPVEVYEVTGATAIRSRFRAATARGLTRFVGRHGELQQLGQALELARTGRGQVVAVVGEPGVGKSRLCWEFTHAQWTQGWLTVESRSASYGRATSYLPIVELLKGYFQIQVGDDARMIKEKVAGKLLSLDRYLEAATPALLWLLDVPGDDPSWERLDPPHRRQQTLESIKRLLLRETQVQPLMIVIENLQWIDAETQALLDSLVESLPTARLLLLVSYRPEYRHAWSAKASYIQLRLDPLARVSASDLLDALLGPDPGLQPLKQAADLANGRQSVLSRGRRAHPRRDEGPDRRTGDVPVVLDVTGTRPGAADPCLGPGARRRAHRSALGRGQAPAPGRVGDRHRGFLRPPSRHRRGGRKRAEARLGPAAGRGVPLRDAPFPRARVHVQARADPRGRLREPRARSPADPSRRHRGGHRAASWRTPR
jgi:class 3 adenylate cyclase